MSDQIEYVLEFIAFIIAFFVPWAAFMKWGLDTFGMLSIGPRVFYPRYQQQLFLPRGHHIWPDYEETSSKEYFAKWEYQSDELMRRVQLALKQQNMSIEQLAEKSCVNKSVLNGFVKRGTNVQFNVLCMIARGLDRELNYFDIDRTKVDEEGNIIR